MRLLIGRAGWISWSSGARGVFAGFQPRRRVRAYLQGLLAPVERKNGWQLAENAGDRTPEGVQDFIARMRWDADRVRDDPGLFRGRLAWGICLSSLIAGIPGELAISARKSALHPCIRQVCAALNHDAVMRIGGAAPGRQAHSLGRRRSHACLGHRRLGSSWAGPGERDGDGTPTLA